MLSLEDVEKEIRRAEEYLRDCNLQEGPPNKQRIRSSGSSGGQTATPLLRRRDGSQPTTVNRQQSENYEYGSEFAYSSQSSRRKNEVVRPSLCQ